MSKFLLATVAIVVTGQIAHAEPPKGEVTKYRFSDSKIFPGTERDYWVYVPKQYDGKTPACLWVNQDGIQFNAPAVFDELIDKKVMPITIGVFVRPGEVPPVNPDALPRYNRSLEYDGQGDAYARFLIEELLPKVESLQTEDGRDIKLSQDPNDRAIAGASSGAICALTVAWERPDSFRRVFSSIGTYVGLRGGNNYPTLIRKTEPKPLRIFLEDGENDLNIYGGDWWMANQEMERALTFAGYEVNHRWGTGGHNQKFATEIFAEAMTWLWKDHGNPIKAGLGSPQMQDVLRPDEDWKLVADGYSFTEGPIADHNGVVYFVDVPKGITYQISLDGKVSEFNKENGKASGLAVGPDQFLYGVGGGVNALVQYPAEGPAKTIAADIQGNDLVALNNGTFYITVPAGKGSIIHVDANGRKATVDTGIQFPNGITTSPDQTLLYVAESRTHWVWSYQIQPDGSLKNKQKYFHLHVPDTAEEAWADGLKVDTEGRLYVATRSGIQFCDQAGRVNGIIPTPRGKDVANLCFGGKDFNTLYITCGDKVYCRHVKPTGYSHFNKPMKPKSPRL